MAYHYSTVVSPWSVVIFFVFKQKTAYEMRISDWSSDVCLPICARRIGLGAAEGAEALQCRTALPAHHVLDGVVDRAGVRSEERRVGKECVSTCRSRWSPDHSKKKKIDLQMHQAIKNLHHPYSLHN